MELTKSDKLKTGKLLGYGTGEFGMTIGWTFLGGFITYYMTNFVGIAAGVAGTIIMLSRILDAVSDVVIGNAVDHTHTKLGKARPWIIFAALPLTISFILLFSVPDLSYTGRLLWFILMYNITATVFYTAVVIPYSALTPLMTRDPLSRVKLNVVRMLMGIFGGVISSSTTMPFINSMGGNKQAWSRWAVIIGIVMFVGILVSGILSKEKYSESQKAKKEKLPIKDSFINLIKNKYWVILTLVMVVSYMLQAVSNGVNIYYFRYIIGNENLMGFASVSLAIPMLIILFSVPLLTKKFNKSTLARFSALGGIIAPLVLLINPTSLVILIIKSVLQGIFMAPFAAVGFAMIADVSDYGYWKSGIKCEGLVNSASSFGIKVGTGLGAGMVGWILSIGKFDAAMPAQPDSAIFAIKILMIGIPIVLTLIQFALLLFYKLDKIYPTILKDIQQRENEQITQGE